MAKFPQGEQGSVIDGHCLVDIKPDAGFAAADGDHPMLGTKHNVLNLKFEDLAGAKVCVESKGY